MRKRSIKRDTKALIQQGNNCFKFLLKGIPKQKSLFIKCEFCSVQTKKSTKCQFGSVLNKFPVTCEVCVCVIFIIWMVVANQMRLLLIKLKHNIAPWTLCVQKVFLSVKFPLQNFYYIFFALTAALVQIWNSYKFTNQYENDSQYFVKLLPVIWPLIGSHHPCDLC